MRWNQSWPGCQVTWHPVVSLSHLSKSLSFPEHMIVPITGEGLDWVNISSFFDLHFLFWLQHFWCFLHFSFEYLCCWGYLCARGCCLWSDALLQCLLGIYAWALPAGPSTSTGESGCSSFLSPTHLTPFPPEMPEKDPTLLLVPSAKLQKPLIFIASPHPSPPSPRSPPWPWAQAVVGSPWTSAPYLLMCAWVTWGSCSTADSDAVGLRQPEAPGV